MFSCKTQNDRLVISAAGKIDSANAGAFEHCIATAAGELEAAEGLVFDLSQLNYISSAGLRVILATLRRCQNKPLRPVLAGMQPLVHEVFEISGFLNFFEVQG